MTAFDDSGDGALQLEEFVTIDQFRNKLSELVREEKVLAAKAKKEAQDEENISKATEAILESINDRPPTISDKIFSVLPYLFPLLDGVQFGRFLLSDETNPLVAPLALLYLLYRSVPFGGFIAFFALSTLSGNFSINRLIRYNMQQAIYLDIALFFPGLLTALVSITGAKIPQQITQYTSDAVFIALCIVLLYCIVSSLGFGAVPDKIPIISNAVSQRMPTADSIDITFLTKNDLQKENKRDNDDDDNKKEK